MDSFSLSFKKIKSGFLELRDTSCVPAAALPPLLPPPDPMPDSEALAAKLKLKKATKIIENNSL